jgi:uridine kinase
MSHFTHVKKRSGAVVPFKKERIANAIYRAAVSVGGRDQQTADSLADKVVRRLEERCPEGYVPHIDEIQDVVEEVLIKNGHSKVAKEYILYRNEQDNRRRSKAHDESRLSENIPWATIWNVLDWAVAHNLHTVDALNSRIRNGEYPDIVQESEAAYENAVQVAAKLILERQQQIKMVFISGPSSSGKTTTTIKLEQRLNCEGLKFVALNVDNYFFDLELHPKDEFGDYDFETPQALDLDLINEHLVALCAGNEILMPHYDFKTSSRTGKTTPIHLEDHDILLLDSLHGLYPPMSRDISNENKFRLYLEPLLQMKGPDGQYIRWSDLRLIRRMLRDAAHRSYDPRRTLEHWHYVRSSELRNIVPYNVNADYIINSGMPYELPLYAHSMRDQFEQWEKDYEGDPLREDAYTRAKRLNMVLHAVEPVADDSVIPGDSVLREFIGGSTLKYA